MRLTRLFVPLFLAALCGVTALSQYAPPPVQKPEADVLKAIEEKTKKLGDEIEHLRKLGVKEPLLADVQVFHRAAVSIVKLGEFYAANSGAQTLAVLDRGLLRAKQLAGGGETPWLNMLGFTVVRGYYSLVDGTIQPYAVTYPAEYGKDPKKKWRVDVVLHGRASSMTEVSFLAQRSTDKPAAKELNHVQIDIYGRGNVAYRWAGESDVYDAVANFVAIELLLGRSRLLDDTRYVLRGFSMGGAGTWQLGLHRPGFWCLLGPGAGFTTTHGYAPIPKQLPSYQEACLTIYDAVDYAENVAMVPVVAYSGEKDKQIQAARNIEERLKLLGLSMTHLIAPDLEHKFPPEWQKKAEAEYAKYVAKGKPEYPNKVRFVTYTLRYPTCEWMDILALDRHYQQARVEAEVNDEDRLTTVKTANVRALHVRLPVLGTRLPYPITIDGQKLTIKPLEIAADRAIPAQDRPRHLYLEKTAGQWRTVLPQWLETERLRRLQKISGLQGPIDDAFMSSFLCVRGTGEPWHKGTEAYARANLERFQQEWAKFMRGDLPIKTDKEVTYDDIAGRHLILFGDPASNTLIEQVVNGLPLKWTRDKITWGGKDYAAEDHVPVMIYPSPLNPSRYVVLNSGHTFHAADFEGTNALLYPRLGDYALLKRTDAQKPLSVEVVEAGLFDDFWKMSGGK